MPKSVSGNLSPHPFETDAREGHRATKNDLQGESITEQKKPAENALFGDKGKGARKTAPFLYAARRKKERSILARWNDGAAAAPSTARRRRKEKT